MSLVHLSLAFCVSFSLSFLISTFPWCDEAKLHLCFATEFSHYFAKCPDFLGIDVEDIDTVFLQHQMLPHVIGRDLV